MSYLDTSVFYVYQLRLETSEEPFYIGKGKKYRINVHLSNNSLKSKSHKNNIIKKAIKDDIKIIAEKLHENLIEEIAISLEIWYIYKFGRIDNKTGILSNHTDGGEGASGRKMTTNNRNKLIIANSGENNYMFGKTPSKERINKMLETNKNKTEKEKINTKNKFIFTMTTKSDEEKRIINNKKNFTKNITLSNRPKELSKAISKAASIRMLELNMSPWENNRCLSNETLNLVWKNADYLYSLFLQGYNTKTKLSKITNIHYSKLANIIKKFNLGWIPFEDSKWNLFKNFI